MGRTMFISGYSDLSEEEFAKHYHAQLEESIDHDDTFIMADSGAMETLAFVYLLSRGVNRSQISHYRLASPAAEADNVPSKTVVDFGGIRMVTVTGTDFDLAEALTKDSKGDILWLRDVDKNPADVIGNGFSQTLSERYPLGPKENARRRRAAGYRRVMALYDEIA